MLALKNLKNYWQSELLLTRLLRAMGWTEMDDDNNGYEITEDDVKQFEDLCRQMKLNKASTIIRVDYSSSDR